MSDNYYLQSRRTYLLYKKAEYLTTRTEDSELEQINKKLNESKRENKITK